MNPELSLCMIVRDEIDCLDRCLASLRGTVDEVVIVDTGSTDGTLELARGRADRLAQLPWGDDFSAARNAALDLASGEWVLVLDADESRGAPATGRRCVGPCGGRTCSAIACASATSSARRRSQRLGDHPPPVPTAIRPSAIRAASRTGLPAVAQLLQREPRWVVRVLDEVAIDHAGVCPRRRGAAAEARAQRAAAARRSLAEQPGDIYLGYKLSQELGDTPEAELLLLAAASQLLAAPEPELRRCSVAAELLTAAAQKWTSNRSARRRFAACRRALAHAADHPGDAPPPRGRPPRARPARRGVAGDRQGSGPRAVAGPASITILGRPRSLARLLRARALRGLGRLRLAQELLEETCSAYPADLRPTHALVEALLEDRPLERALRVALSGLRQHPGDALLLLRCADAAERLGDTAQARAWRAKVLGFGS